MNLARLTCLSVIFFSAIGCNETRGGLDAIEADPEYRTAVATFGDQAPDEATAFSEAIKNDTHSDYIAFLENYPDTKHRLEVEEQLKQFRLFSAKKERFVSYDELEKMCWPKQAYMGYWRASNQLAGMMTGGSGATFGPIMFFSPKGSIQIISGGYSGKEGGYSFTAGSKLIYSTKCLSKDS